MAALMLMLRYGLPIVAAAVSIGISIYVHQQNRPQRIQYQKTDTCEICKKEVKKGKTKFNCGHIFHTECWLTIYENTQQQTCPVQSCRYSVFERSY